MKLIRILFTTLLLTGIATLANAQPPTYYGGPALHPFNRTGSPFRSGYSDFRITREVTQNAYILKIRSDTLSNESVQIIPRPHRIIITRKHTSGRRYHGDRGAYRYTRQWGSASQNIPLPRDANINRMRRTDEDGVITLTIPRGAYWR